MPEGAMAAAARPGDTGGGRDDPLGVRRTCRSAPLPWRAGGEVGEAATAAPGGGGLCRQGVYGSCTACSGAARPAAAAKACRSRDSSAMSWFVLLSRKLVEVVFLLNDKQLDSQAAPGAAAITKN